MWIKRINEPEEFSEIVITSLKTGADFKKREQNQPQTFKLGIRTTMEKPGSSTPAQKRAKAA
jgi:hypothetical protein